jgi:ribokinase
MITVFGSINLDLIGNVERLPRPGETVPGSGFATAAGGKGANQALAVARAGAAIRMVGAVGKDDFAPVALALLRAGNVDLSRVRAAGRPTGVALILVEAGGENVIAVIPGANGTMSEADAEMLDFDPRDVLVLQLEVPVSSIEVAAKRARAAGAHVLLNFAPFRADALGLIPYATHLIVNETECALIASALGMSGGEPAAQAQALVSGYGNTVIVTLGKDGVLAAEAGEVSSAPALAVEAIDTVGAGDTFCGYLAAALAEGQLLEDALRLAATAGSLACTKAGAQPSVPMRAEVEAAMLAATQVVT